MNFSQSSSARRRRKASRGQALVEFALFVPLLMAMVIGATDVSTLLDDHLDVVYAARAGARVGSVIGNLSPSGAPTTADCAVIGAVQAALASTRDVTVNQIVIYNAGPNGQPLSNTSGVMEDVYPGNAVCNANGTISPAATVTNWAPNGGSGAAPSRDPTPFLEDSIGVSINYTYTYQFNPLGGQQFTATDNAVMPIEIVISTPRPQSTATP